MRVIAPKDQKQKKKLYTEALLNSFNYWVDELDCDKSFARQKTTKSFNEVLGICLKGNSHWTILFRQRISEPEYWEFGVSSMRGNSQFIWIKVRTDLAEKIFEKYSLKIEK